MARNSWVLFILLAFLISVNPCLAAKTKKKKKIRKDNTIAELMKKRPADTDIYNQYFSATDQKLSRAYTQGELPEGTDRTGVANTVLRERINVLISEVKRKSPEFQAAEKTQKLIQAISQVSIKSDPKPNEVPTEWRMGYDVFNDAARLECRKGVWSASIFQPAFFGTGTKGQAFFDNINIKMVTEFPSTNSSAYLAYRWNSYLLETGVSKKLSKTVETQVSTTQPIKDGTSSYLMKFLFNF